VQERATLTGRADPRQIALFGLDTGKLLEGLTAVEARYERRRNGAGAVAVRGDLRDARLVFNPAGWEKPPGTPGAAEAVLRLQGDALLSADGIRLDAADLSLRGGRALFGAGGKRLDQVEIAEGRFGATRISGAAVQRPLADGTAEGEAWRAALRGPLLDLRPFLAPAPPSRRAAAESDPDDRSLPITLDLRFDRALAGESGEFTGVGGGAWFDAASVMRALRATGRTAGTPNGGGGAFDLTLSPDGQRRVLRVSAEDGGAFLRAIDINSISGGRLLVNGAYETQRTGAALSGTAELDGFVLRDAPAAAKVLQAMTLYGLVEAMQGGDGVVFSRLVAPFALTPEALVLRDARAFSASLGVTAKGRILRERRVAEVEGTIVPAYVFNSLLGRVPLVGRLFSPGSRRRPLRRDLPGAGAAGRSVRHREPARRADAGFLRGLFGIFDQGRGERGRRGAARAVRRGRAAAVTRPLRADRRTGRCPLPTRRRRLNRDAAAVRSPPRGGGADVVVEGQLRDAVPEPHLVARLGPGFVDAREVRVAGGDLAFEVEFHPQAGVQHLAREGAELRALRHQPAQRFRAARVVARDHPVRRLRARPCGPRLGRSGAGRSTGRG
jgi:hypothetical protein